MPTQNKTHALWLHQNDNVVVVSSETTEGERVFFGENDYVVARANVPMGHKLAKIPIARGSPITKLGCVIGVATGDVAQGEHVHTHNVRMPDAAADAIKVISRLSAKIPTHSQTTFLGYPRPDGAVGTRNYIVVLATVNCSASVTKMICRAFAGKDLKENGIHGIIPVADPAGCTQEIGGLYHNLLNRTLSGWAFHPNVVGAIIVGLGCEGTTAKTILESAKSRGRKEVPIKSLGIQEIGGTSQAIATGIEYVEEILSSLPTFKRQPAPVSALTVALNCGGSDAFSSLTANPALGVASDMLVSAGGTVALAEIPECHGAETLLFSRLSRKEDHHRLKEIFAWWDRYAISQNLSLNDNLAVGNRDGGITTIIEKSIGAVAKAGTTPIQEIVDYASQITRKGFVLMNTPGYDPVSVTGLVAGGCNLVAFTTGRGSVYGCSIAPTIKIATTSILFNKMRGDMDIDAGRVLETSTIEQIGQEIFSSFIDTASGETTCSERLGLGWEEFVPWAIGEML